ncbi:hypothetical protein [Streptomyces sp. ISL-86]|uniref:hypothetical protein n=1 Tax=Streptomyces sp. ISL-86 TaxID=2819187 RepID=UPI001BE9BB82|nr:hypothetical protein [Streptomyces sp. ISL-86]
MRTALVFLLAVLAAVAAGLLTFRSGSLSQACLAGGAAFGVAFPFFDAVIADV